MQRGRKSGDPPPEFRDLAQDGGIGKQTRRRRRAAKALAKEEPPPPSLLCAAASELTEEKVTYLWEGRLPERAVTLLAGPSETGKSTVATAIAAMLTVGSRLPGGPHLQRRQVLWYAAEELIRASVRPRLRVAGADLGRVFFPELAPDGTRRPRPQLPRDAGQVQELARQLGAGLVVFDPINSYCESGMNPDHGTTARPVCQALLDLCQQANTTVLIIKHPRKGSTGTPLERISGSSEWTNHPRQVLIVARHPERPDESCLAAMKGSLSKRKPPCICYRIVDRDGVPLLEWEEEEDLNIDVLLEDAGSASDRDALADARTLLIDRLSHGEQRVKDLLRWAEDSGISGRTLWRAKQALKVTSHPVGPNESRYQVWRAPKDGFPRSAVDCQPKPEGAS